MAANIVGPRAKYKYTMDDGTIIKLRLDKDLGDLAACGLSPVVTGDNASNKPTNFKPRVVHWQVILPDGKISRKQLVCSSTSDAYTSVDPFNISIDGIAGQTTGRRGEQISF